MIIIKFLLFILIILLIFLIIQKIKKKEPFGKKLKKLKKKAKKSGGNLLKKGKSAGGNLLKKGKSAGGNLLKKGKSMGSNLLNKGKGMIGKGGGGGGGERDVKSTNYSDLNHSEQVMFQEQAKLVLDKFKKTLENRKDANDVYNSQEISEILQQTQTLVEKELVEQLSYVLNIYRFSLYFLNKKCQNDVEARDATTTAAQYNNIASSLKLIEDNINNYANTLYEKIVKISDELDNYEFIELKYSHLETDGEDIETDIADYIKISEKFLSFNPEKKGIHKIFCIDCKGNIEPEITCSDFDFTNYITGKNIKKKYKKIKSIQEKIIKLKEDFREKNNKTRLTDLLAAGQSDKKFKNSKNLFNKTMNNSLSGSGNPDIDIGNNASDFSPNVENPDLSAYKPDYFKSILSSIQKSFKDFNDGKLEKKYRNNKNFFMNSR